MARTVPERKRPPFEAWDGACREYASQGDAVFAKYGLEKTYFCNRYSEWKLWRALMQGIDLSGKTALDVGAGEGFDSWRFLAMGARVIGLDYNPSLAGQGKRNLPEMFWLSGFSHILPLKDESVDFVACNAALHHMLFIPQAISEFLRVVKPGGVVITAADSFSGANWSEGKRLRIFNSDAPTLSGVNEQAPNVENFIEALLKYKNSLTVEIFTHNTDTSAHDAFGQPVAYFRQWSFDEFLKVVPTLDFGGISMRISKKCSLDIPPALQRDGWLAPQRLLKKDKASEERLNEAVETYVAAHGYVNTPLPRVRHDKFLQLNGWRLPEAGCAWQEGWGRANSFWQRGPEERSLSLELDLPAQGTANYGNLEFLINGSLVKSLELERGRWWRISVPLDAAPAGKPFILTVRCGDHAVFENRLMRFRKAALTPANGEDAALELDENPSVAALLAQFASGPLPVLWLPQDPPTADVRRAFAAPRFTQHVPLTQMEFFRVAFPDLPLKPYAPDRESFLRLLESFGENPVVIVCGPEVEGELLEKLRRNPQALLVSCALNGRVPEPAAPPRGRGLKWLAKQGTPPFVWEGLRRFRRKLART
ncbi:MAG: class I SAM-dependent methyltransferase [Desulfovibrio sp.]|nr:class I SAM-dependent methyltransferase [Desulfovibrio sp.]